MRPSLELRVPPTSIKGGGADPAKKLRRKLGDDAARPAYVLTERGVGYRIATPADS